MSTSIDTKVDLRTDTKFGWHSDMFDRSRKLLKVVNRPLNGLVIGAGLDYDDLMRAAEKEYLGFSQSDVFSWEPLEMLRMLRAVHPDSTVTVIDINEDVCRRLSEQSHLPINDFYRTPMPYVQDFLAGFSHQRLDNQGIGELNRKLKEKHGIYKVNVVANANVPVLDSILNQDFLSERADLAQYDVIALLESGIFIEPRYKVPDRINEVLKHGGILLFASSFPSCHPSQFIGRQHYFEEYPIFVSDREHEIGRLAILVK